ncbi:serine/threonine-protein phosphatase [Streptomyces sp. NBC_01387]|uniref:PP2C family protein-serine/threonine phosphatase n=1 Tax=unclassified Streptomyces TaxID=2593676 RepID=UPI0020251D41|nr:MULTISPECIES: PP2C family protein-serine/threonine phosphatase [unclassified Streptomyces]MCX4552798.1 serine/threonine-protein phosphatase [Streptomyces sp. NBC_01500]WSC24132.1 serine/threonine-protein phosphatase [Streptomyces sp. NBC_01766]WSV58019.1 serine/threonine-protein phosphatase [Streptomyces sp. NBC_01014]
MATDGTTPGSREQQVKGLSPTSVKVPWALAALSLIAGALLDLTAPQPYMGLPLLAASPMIAGAMLSLRATVVFGGLACVASVTLDYHHARPLSANFVDLAVVALIGVLAVLVNRLMERQGRDLAVARDVAEALQRAVLPDPPTHAGHLAVAAGYTAAETEARIGGDLFAVQDTPFGVRMMIGDVRGKGLQAISSVSVTVGAFRQEAERASSLAELAHQLDEALSREAERSSREIAGEDFTTVVLAEVSPDGGVLRLVNRGHPAPYLLDGGRLLRLDPTVPQLPLGMRLAGPATPEDDAQVDVLRLPPTAMLLMITDGVTEARNRDGVFYDPCTSRLAGHRFTDPASLIDALTADVTRWTGGTRQDDMAILAIAGRNAEDTAA